MSGNYIKFDEGLPKNLEDDFRINMIYLLLLGGFISYFDTCETIAGVYIIV